LSYVDLQDVAQAAAVILTGTAHEDATYSLAGTSGISQFEVAESLSSLTKREVEVEVVPLAEWERQARARGWDDYRVGALVHMFHYYAQHGLLGNPQVLSWLLGHPPTSMEAFLEGAFYQPT
jgi:hypothetical protein